MDDVNWSAESLPLTRTLPTLELPCVVQIAFGYYGDMEMDSFSTGDLIRFDKCVDKRQMVVRNSGSSQRGVTRQPYLIPVDTLCEIKVRVQTETYDSVSGLTRAFPRFVRTLDSITDPEFIPAGSLLELDDGGFQEQLSESYQLRCKLSRRHIYLSQDKCGSFISQPDPTIYTPSTFLDRYSLPQLIELQKSNGESLLLDVIGTEGVRHVLGYYKSANVETGGSVLSKRALFCLDLDSKLAKMTDIRLPVYNDPSDYEVVVERIFPSKQCDPLGLDTTLYIEFKKESPLKFFDETHSSELQTPPALPPDRKYTTKTGRTKPSSQKEYVSMESDSATSLPPPIPSRDCKFYKKNIPKASRTPADMGCIAEMFGSWSASESDLSSLKSQESEHKKGKQVLGKGRNIVGNLIKPIKPKQPKKVCAVTPMQKSPETKTSNSNQNVDYLTPELIKVCPDVSLPAKVKKKTVLQELLSKFGKHAPSKPTLNRSNSESAPPTHLSQTENKSEDKRIRQNVSSPGATEMTHGRIESKSFSQCSVREIHQLFLDAGMERVARVCSAQKLDGAFLSTTDNTILRSEPFNLNDFDVLKFERLKTGWRPKT